MRQRIYQIVGFRDDITYAERIWFNVFKTFVSNVNPRWDVDKSLEFNAYTFASAGVSWKDQVLLAEKAKDDRLDWPWRYQCDDPDGDFFVRYEWSVRPVDPGNVPWGRVSTGALSVRKQMACDAARSGLPVCVGGSELRNMHAR